MPDIEKVDTWQGRTLLDRDGGRIGTIDAIYLDDRTGQPAWALVNTGLFGTRASFVPLAGAFQSDLDVLVPYDKQLVTDAPRIDPDQHLSEAEERQLWRHYGLDDDTQWERGRVRLRKYVTTEHLRTEVDDGHGTRGRHKRR
jgi:PRC-barrel domain